MSTMTSNGHRKGSYGIDAPLGLLAAVDKAIDEALRVLRPGGRLLIADISATAQYKVRLAALGALDITRRNLGWRLWWSGPWMPTYLLTATKPGA